MAFNSVLYFFFLIFTVIVFYNVKSVQLQRFVLIASNLAFIAFFNWLSLFFLIFIVVINYYILRLLSDSNGLMKKRLYYLGLGLNIGLLIIYKILQEVISESTSIIQGFNNNNWIVLGIAFYTLQIIGYYFEVFKTSIPFSYNISDFFISVGFFAKLSSGPILNNKDSIRLLSPKKVQLEEHNIAFGVQRISLGMLKKVVLADRLLPYVTNVFDKHQYINGLMIYLGPFLFTMQLYFDFSGYIDIAIGSARLFGIKLPENFNLPLRSRSIADFWRRWHISLVNWLTNFIFFPISFRFRKMGKKGVAIAIVSTFIVSAVWHGLAITFFIYAFCHFSFLIIENLFFKGVFKPEKNGCLLKIVSVIIIWHLVALGNFFFRLNHLHDAKKLISDFVKLPFLYENGLSFKTWLINGGQDIENEFNFRLTVLLCLMFLVFERKINQFANSEKYQITFVALLLVLIAVFGMFNTGERFIYLQFS
jgi:alginate O-acetyltransferase complex protein AlgI